MIKIICVGKIKEKYWQLAIDEYLKRLYKYTKISIIECSDYDYNDINKTLEKEKDIIVKHISDKDYIITMEIDGIMMDSVTFSNYLEKQQINYTNITFIIGGSYGLHQYIKQISNKSISFSKMTFPHQLFRIILLEQIYRSYRIKNNETYHK